MEWPRMALGEVSRLQAGIGFPPAIQGRTGSEVPFVKVGDISAAARSGSSTIGSARNHITTQERLALRASLVPANSVLFAKIGEAIRQNFRVIAEVDLLIDNNAMAAIPNHRIDSRYLFRFLQTIDMYALASSTTVPSLRKSDLEALRVPLPPLPEQRRIASLLDQADNLRAKRRRALVEIERIIVSRFQELTSSGRVESVELLGNLVEISARLVDPKLPQFANMQLIGSDAIESGTGRLQNMGTAAAQGAISGKYLYEPSAILYSKIRPVLNKVALPIHGGLCSADIYPLMVVSQVVNREFLWATLRAADFLAFAAGLSNRAQMPKLNREQLLSYPVSVPPLTEQEILASTFDAAAQVTFAMTGHLRLLDELFASLQYRAFRGEL